MNLKSRVVEALRTSAGKYEHHGDAESSAYLLALAAELDGMVIVPREPTMEMCFAGDNLRWGGVADGREPVAKEVYAAMITESEKCPS